MTRRKEPPPETPADLVPAVEIEPVAPPIDPADPVDPAPAPETATEAAMPEPAAPSRSESPAPPQPRQSGILGPLLGGALAAIGGFAVSHFNLLGLAAPDASVEVAALGVRLDEIDARQSAAIDRTAAEIAAIASRISTLETAPAPNAPDLSRLDAVEARLAAIEAAPGDGAGGTAALAARLADLERQLSALPAAGPSPEIQQQLDQALSRLDAAEAEAKTRAAEAESAAASARRAEALDALAAAVEAGRPFTAELQALADPALTSALGALAESGAPTLARLQAEFPDAAREALRIARDISAEDGWTERIFDFLAAQTEARPLTPLEGSSPDAILSRAEFALSEARVADALAELETLDPAVKAPFEAWIRAATGQIEATAALRSARGE